MTPPTVMALLLKPASLPCLALMGVLGTTALAALQLPTACALFTGVCIGAAARDLGIALKVVKHWPIQCELLDWQKVEEAAAGDER